MGKLKGMVPFITEDEIEQMTNDLAKQIEKDYEKKDLVLVCPLKGSIIFCADLMRKLSLPLVVDFVHLTSPKGESVRILKDLSENIYRKDVLIVEEIIDAGRTLSFLCDRIAASSPASLKIVTLLDKPARRELPIQPDYVGKTIDDRYLIGYGLDSEEIGRNYKDIYNFAQ
jgi:hypoxanthine phosphoribosyltransferase